MLCLSKKEKVKRKKFKKPRARVSMPHFSLFNFSFAALLQLLQRGTETAVRRAGRGLHRRNAGGGDAARDDRGGGLRWFRGDCQGRGQGEDSGDGAAARLREAGY